MADSVGTRHEAGTDTDPEQGHEDREPPADAERPRRRGQTRLDPRQAREEHARPLHEASIIVTEASEHAPLLVPR